MFVLEKICVMIFGVLLSLYLVIKLDIVNVWLMIKNYFCWVGMENDILILIGFCVLNINFFYSYIV